MIEEKTFVEQAEYIDKEEFLNLSSDHPNERAIVRKLTQSGAKLITGPRGCGKTTLILKAYYKLLSGKNSAFPVYVNFKTSLKLEPNYRESSSGTYWFVNWMYTKIYLGIYNTLEDLKIGIDLGLFNLPDLNSILENIELGRLDIAKEKIHNLSIKRIQNDVGEILINLGRKRCIIFFDDAAHAFSPDQQRDFFDLFRKIKNKDISPKAAIYPGVTNFSPAFNVGHDAEQINVWINPEQDDYLEFMMSLLRKRLPTEVIAEFEKDIDFLHVICYCAFGIPRQLLNIVRNLYEVRDKEISVTFNRKSILTQIQTSYRSTLDVFSSLGDKMPTYRNFISEGLLVYDRIRDQIYAYNRNKTLNKKAITIAIKKEINPDLKKILGFFQYAGLIANKDQVNKGDKGTFQRYIVNIAALVEKNALLTTARFNSKELAQALKDSSAHDFTRTSSDNLLSNGISEIRLSLPPCQNCQKPRLNENARFCYNCGAQLKQASIYKQLIEGDISNLPLTERRVSAIKENSSITKVKDIIYDIGHTELRSVPQIGDFWGAKILQLAEEYIS